MINHALTLALRGFRVFPVDNNKRPLISAWQNLATTHDLQIREWWGHWPGANVGVACGRKSDLVVIDVDDVAAAADVMDRLPATFTVATPRGGLHFYFRFPRHTDDDDVIRNVQGRRETDALGRGVDVRGEGGYVLAVGSVIGDAGYEVANDVDIAEIPEWVLERLRKAKRHQAPIPMPAWTPDLSTAKTSAVERARRYVSRMPAAISGAGGHNATIKVARVLVTGFGLDDGDVMSVLQEYNGRCSPPWSPRELEHKVRSARVTPDPRGNSAGHMLRRSSDSSVPDGDPFGGAEIVVSRPQEEPTAPFDVSELRKVIAIDHDEAQWAMLRQVRALGGLCDDFAGWVLDGADFQQPGLTVGAVVALGAAVSARRWTYGRAVGSLYVCAVAPTASGKGRPQGCVSQALRASWADTVGANDLSSTKSTIARIQTASGRGTGLCLVLDEYGPRLKALLDGKSNFQRDTRALLLQLATTGTGDYVASSSVAAGGDDVTITAPGLTIYGSSTAVALHDAIGNMALEDGLVGRHVFFEALSRLPPRHKGPADTGVPMRIRCAIDEIRKSHQAWHAASPPCGSTSKGDPILLYRPDEIDDDGGQAVLDAFALDCDERRRNPSSDDVPAEILGRAAEHAQRICVGLSVLVCAHPAYPLVTADIARCAVAIVEASMAAISRSLREHAADGDWERKIQKFKRAVRESARWDGWAGWTAVTRKCQGLRANETNEITAQLLAAGVLEAVEEKTTGRPVRLVRLLN